MREVYVRGIGLFSPGYANPQAWCRNEPDSAVVSPPATQLEGALRRRAPVLTRMAVEVLAQAQDQAGCDAATSPSIWATAYGEHSTAMKLLGMMVRGEGKVSPTHFHNSVHNTASGYASIAGQNHAPSTTLTGGAELASAAFTEVFCLLQLWGGDVSLVLADEALQVPFDRDDLRAPLALAFCLSSIPQGAIGVLTGLRREPVSPHKRYEQFGGLHVSAALPLLERVFLRRPGTVPLELEGGEPGPVWCVDLALIG